MSTPEIDQLVARLKAIRPGRFSHTAYRSATPEYATEDDLLTGEGSRLHGARWNPPGIAAVYASFEPETAMKEALAHFRYYGISPHAAMPRVFVAIVMRLSKVCDLTKGEQRKRLQISKRRLLECDWRQEMNEGREALSQRVGRAALAADFEAMVVPSAEDANRQNIVLFPINLRSSSKLAVLDADQLAP